MILCAAEYERCGLCSVRPKEASSIAELGSLMKWNVSLDGLEGLFFVDVIVAVGAILDMIERQYVWR